MELAKQVYITVIYYAQSASYTSILGDFMQWWASWACPRWACPWAVGVMDGHSIIQIAHRPPWTGDGHLLGVHGRAISQSIYNIKSNIGSSSYNSIN